MKLRIGSRGSKLAVTQAEWVAGELQKKAPGLEVEFSRITTTGDRDGHSALSQIGGKGVFVKEIEDALLRREIDVAVHSLKDVPQSLPAGLRLGPYPRREDNRDAFISRFGEQLHELPRRSTIGTSSPRRQAQIHHRYGKRGYCVEPLRGNVETRLEKLQKGQYDGIIIAYAGIRRIGLESEVTQILEPEEMLPAPGQGCLALELREGDEDILKILETIKDEPSNLTALAERAFLQGLGGSCTTPVAAMAKIVNSDLVMEAFISDVRGQTVAKASEKGSLNQAEYVGHLLAERLLYEGGAEILMKTEKP